MHYERKPGRYDGEMKPIDVARVSLAKHNEAMAEKVRKVIEIHPHLKESDVEDVLDALWMIEK